MQPEETLQAHLDLKGARLLPIHNGTFDLAFHAWLDPFERIADLARTANVQLITPRMGEAVAIESSVPHPQWWREVDRQQGWRGAPYLPETA